MSNALMLGIDVGTGSAKGVLADAAGKFFDSASQVYQYESQLPNSAEQSPDVWWKAVCIVTAQLLRKHPEAAGRLRGIAISGQGVAAVVLDDQGEPLRKAMLWMDTRCSSQAEQMAAEHGDAIWRVSGKKPAAYNVEPKLLWMRENEPELWAKAWKVTTTTGYINLRLTGQAVMNHSDAGILLSYDLSVRHWSLPNMTLMGLPREIFFDLAESDTIIGRVTGRAAEESGLPVGIPVVAGGEDTSSAGLAMGVISETDVQLSMGTACTVYMPFRSPVTDPRLLAFPHVMRGQTLMGGSMVSGGISIEWLMKLLGLTGAPGSVETPRLLALSAEAEQVSASGDGLVFLPYLAGELQPINDGYARGCFLGLTLQTTPAHLLRAVMEGTAFAIRHNLDVLRECGAEPRKVMAVGGPSKSDLWCQLIADASGLPIHAMQDNAGAAFGDAILAAMGLGEIGGPSAMQQSHARPRRVFEPCGGSRHRYDELYAIYLQLYPRLRDLFPKLSHLSRSSKEESFHVHV